jgi:hypothetical protein
MHPEGPVTGQLDQVFPCFSSVLQQMPIWYPIPRYTSYLICILYNINIKISPQSNSPHARVKVSPISPSQG